MSTRERGERFRKYVGLELKGAIQSRDRTAKDVAEEIGRAPEAFNRWLNDKKPLSMSVLNAACEAIGVDPKEIVGRAYARVVRELGDYRAPSAPVIHAAFGTGTGADDAGEDDMLAAASDSANTTEDDRSDEGWLG